MAGFYPADGLDGEGAAGAQYLHPAPLEFIEADKRVVAARAARIAEKFHSGRLIRTAIHLVHRCSAEGTESGHVREAA